MAPRVQHPDEQVITCGLLPRIPSTGLAAADDLGFDHLASSGRAADIAFNARLPTAIGWTVLVVGNVRAVMRASGKWSRQRQGARALPPPELQGSECAVDRSRRRRLNNHVARRALNQHI